MKMKLRAMKNYVSIPTAACLDPWLRAFSVPRLDENVLGSNSSNGGNFKAFIEVVQFLFTLEPARNSLCLISFWNLFTNSNMLAAAGCPLIWPRATACRIELCISNTFSLSKWERPWGSKKYLVEKVKPIKGDQTRLKFIESHNVN